MLIPSLVQGDCNMNVFGGILVSANLSVHLSESVYKILISNFASQTPPSVLLLLNRKFVDTFIEY